MSETDSLNYLETEIDKRLNTFNANADFYRSAYRATILATTTLSATATVLIGVSQKWPTPWISIPALVCTAATSVIAAYDSFLRSKDLWILNNDTYVGLRTLKSTILYAKTKASGPLSQNDIDVYFAQYLELLKRQNENWRVLRTLRDPPPLRGPPSPRAALEERREDASAGEDTKPPQ